MDELYRLAGSNFLTLLFVFVRVGIVFGMVPFFSSNLIPRRITALIALFLSLVLLPVVPPCALPGNDLFALVALLLQDALVGMTIGLCINVIFAGAQTGGQYIGFQMGFAIANVVDHMTGINAPVTANLLYITAFLLFLSFGGDHMLVKSLVDSFLLVPLDGSMPYEGYFIGMVNYAGNMFVIALKIAAPVIGILLIINVAFGLTARAVPQMNVFLMSFPITIAVGLSFIVIVIKMMPFFLEGSLSAALKFIAEAFGTYH